MFTLLVGCNSKDRVIEDKQVFKIGENIDFSTVIADAIEQSKIRKKGYVVIIPSQQKKYTKEANIIMQEFYRKEIMAVHILNLNTKEPLKKTEILTIENATIICLIGNGSMQINNKSYLKIPLVNALKKNTRFVVSNKEIEQQLLLMKEKP